MRLLTPAFLFLTLLACSLHAATPIPLFNGRDLEGWRHETTGAAQPLAVTHAPEGVIAFTGQPVSYLATNGTYRNYRLHAEWRWPGKPGNGGVLVHITTGPKDRAWPECFQVQLKHGAAGDLLPMAGAKFAEPLTSAPGTTEVRARQAADRERPAGEWNECDVVCADGTITVTINGVVQNRVSGCSAAAGRVGFQLEGAPFELRHATLTPLD